MTQEPMTRYTDDISEQEQHMLGNCILEVINDNEAEGLNSNDKYFCITGHIDDFEQLIKQLNRQFNTTYKDTVIDAVDFFIIHLEDALDTAKNNMRSNINEDTVHCYLNLYMLGMFRMLASWYYTKH